MKLKPCENARQVVTVSLYKDRFDSMVGGDSTAHCLSFHCFRALELWEDTSQLEKLLEESKSLPISYDAVRLLSGHYLKCVPNTDEWYKSLRTWLDDHLAGKNERPKRPHKKGQQPGENTPVLGRWEAGRDNQVAWLVQFLKSAGYTLDDAAEIIKAVYPMSKESILGAYYKFKPKAKGEAQVQIPYPYVNRKPPVVHKRVNSGH